TGCAIIHRVAEVADEVQHPAPVGVGVAPHPLQLLLAERTLLGVPRLPTSTAPRRAAIRVQLGPAVVPQLLQRLLDDLLLELHAAREVSGRLRGLPQSAMHPRDRFGRRVVPGEEALVDPTIHEGLEQHRARGRAIDRKSTRLNSSHVKISYAVFCLKTIMKLRATSPPVE